MKHVLTICAALFAINAHADIAPKRLKCNTDMKVAGAEVPLDKPTFVKVLEDDSLFQNLKTTYETITTPDGRFKVQYWGHQEKNNPDVVRASVYIFDNQTKAGAQAGNVLIGSAATPLVDLIYVFDSEKINGPADNFIQVHCEIQ